MAIFAAVPGSRSAAGQPAAADGLLGATIVELGTIFGVPSWACGFGCLCQIEGGRGVRLLQLGGIFHQGERIGCDRTSDDGQDE